MIQVDALIVGAGPVGGYLAKRLANRGKSVLMVEEHSQIGRPFQCAGLVNPGSMAKVGLEKLAQTRIWGARIHGPEGTLVEIGSSDRTRTWSVCRKLFDEAVVNMAISSGAGLMLNSRPVETRVLGDRVETTIESDSGTIQVSSRVLLGADGAHSWTRRYHRMGRVREMMIGFQIDVTGYAHSEGKLDMYTGRTVAPGFFAWAIPTGTTTRIGTFSRPDLLEGRSSEDTLNSLLNHHLWRDRFSGCSEVGRYCGPVPAKPVRRPSRGRVMLFGDAAGLCKPTTGGGIGPGFDHVDALVGHISEVIESDEINEKSSDKICIDAIKPIAKKHDRARALRDAFLTSTTDEELEAIFKVWAKPEVIALIQKYGEIENPIPLGLRLLKDVPEFRKLARKAAGSLIFA
ncbi:MAG TPA: geranylgeranyl reductase family protein [Candidatus Poseidoniales archaeon]|nr:MAG TPA: geranylgeranyl reductase family protein [Candidatus Poseidoniales archaeon]